MALADRGIRKRGALELLLILLIFSSAGFAERLPFKVYTTEEGLAHDSVNRIVKDSRGFMWFCTSEGLSRFDGSRFTTYTQDEGLPHRNINDLLETKDGTYLIATSLGLTVFNPMGKVYRWNLLESKLEQDSDEVPMFQTFAPKAEKRQAKIVISLVQDDQGTIWAGTAFGLFKVKKVGNEWQFEEFEPEKGIKVGYYALIPDSRGNLLIASDIGVYKIGPDEAVEKFDKFGAHSMMEDRDGNIWVGAGGDQIGIRIFTYQNGSLVLKQKYTEKDGLPTDSFQTALKQASDGQIYVGTHKGLSEFVSDARGNDPKFRALENDKIVSIAEDAGGNLWFATEAKGAWKLPQRGFTNFSEKDGIAPTEDFRTIYTSRDGEIIIPTRPQRILYRTNGRFESIIPLGFKARSWGWHFLDFKSKDGEWWIPGNDGLWNYPKVEKFSDLAHTRPKKVYTTADGFVSNDIFNLFEDSGGNIWITTGDTVTRIEYGTKKIDKFSGPDGLPVHNGVITFAEDSFGSIWLGYYFGSLARYRNGKFVTFSAKDGLPESQVSDLLSDKRGRLWVGTSGFGMFLVENPNDEKPIFKSISTQNGLSSNQIICMTEDRFERVYIGTGRGINRIDPNGNVRVFTQADGLASNFITRCSSDKEGFLWFVSGNTLVRFSPEIKQESSPMPVLIDRFSVNGVPQKISALGEREIALNDLSSDQRQIQINFFAMTFGAGENIRYQYTLDDQDWSSPTEQQTINLDLSAGKHSFAVRAVRNDGITSESPATISFRILSPVWTRWWFLALCFLLVGGLVVGFYSYRTARLREVNVALEEARLAEENLRKGKEDRIVELERVRSRIATDLHDDIGASLTQIAVLSEVAQTQTKRGNGAVEGPLTKITEVSNELVGTMSDIVWSINPAKDHLSDLSQRMRRFAADLLASSSIRFHFQGNDNVADTVINSNLRREVFLIFKESINNVVKHSGAKNVWTDLNVVAGNIKLIIRDDGNGFDPESDEIADTGNGLASMRRRTHEMGGVFEVRSSPDAETTVLVSFPVDQAAVNK